ncbi:hypothetical protein [Mucilaginibacter sp.]
MKKIYLSVLGFSMLCRFAGAQVANNSLTENKSPFTISSPANVSDTTDYKLRKIHVDEVDFVSSYYNQTGDHSAVTGGIGTEAVTDVANGLTLNLVWINKAQNKKHTCCWFRF